MHKGIIVSSGEKSKEFAVEICSRNEKVFLPDHSLNSHSLMACSTVSIISRRALSAFMASSREMEIRRVGKNASMPQAFRSRASLVALPESKSLGRTFSAVGDRPDHDFGIRIRQKYPVPNCLPGLQRGQGSFERICCNYNLHVELSPSGFFSASFFLPFRPSGPGSLLPAGRDPHPSAVRPGAKPRYLPPDSGPFGTVTWLYPGRFSARDFLTVIVSAWNSRYNKVGKSSKFKCCMAYCRSLPMHLFIQGKNPFGMVTLVCGVHASVHTREELQYRY